MFDRQYHELELLAINDKDSNEAAKYIQFFVNWALKESFVKAIGLGLQYDLQDVSI